MTLKRKHRYLLSLLSGLLMVFSFPFTGSLTPLVFIAWVPLLLLEDHIHRSGYRPRKLFVHNYIAFLVYNLGATWWVYYASPEGAIMAFVLNSLLMAIAFQLFHFTKRSVGAKEGYIALVIYWISFEYFHYNWESSWPWLTMGNVFSIRTTWIQWYEFTGVLGGSMWVLIVNLIIFKILKNIYVLKESRRIQTPLFYVLGFALAFPLLISIVMFIRHEEKGNKIEVVAVQPNIDPYIEKFGSDVFQQLDKLVDLAAKKVTPNTKLIVAPETAISMSFNEDALDQPYTYANMLNAYFKAQANKLNHVPICIGASTHRFFADKNSYASFYLEEQGRYVENYNTSVLIDTNQFTFVHKSKLVPGVEKIPFASSLPFLEDLSIDLGGTTGTLGVEEYPKVLHTNDFTFAPVVCYESAFGEFIAQQCRQGASFVCIVTNDGWWKDTPGYKQHASFARLRAIENRRAVVRAANTGISCFVDQKGTVQAATGWWVPDVISGNIQLNTEQTVYTQFGDYFGRSLSFVSVLLILFSFVKRFKKYFGKE